MNNDVSPESLEVLSTATAGHYADTFGIGSTTMPNEDGKHRFEDVVMYLYASNKNLVVISADEFFNKIVPTLHDAVMRYCIEEEEFVGDPELFEQEDDDEYDNK